MTEFERLIRASNFCHTMSVLALQKNCISAFDAWRSHARAYASAAKILSRRKWRDSISYAKMKNCRQHENKLCRSLTDSCAEHY